MSIISPLPYTIVNGSVIDANPVMADFNQIVSDVNSNAAEINGSTAQVFNVATATTNNEAIPYGQVQSEFAAVLGSPVFQFAVAPATTVTKAVALGQLAAPSPNLLVNGSAEFGSLAWSLPSQANYATGLGGEGTFFAIGSAVNGTYVATSADYAVVPGIALTLQAEISATGLTAGQLIVDIEFLNSSHTVIYTTQAPLVVSADQDWAFMSASATTPAGAAYWHARFYMLGATLTSGGVRKIKVSGGTAASPYSREADFPDIQTRVHNIAPSVIAYGGGAAANTTYAAPTISFTAPSNGYVMVSATFNINAVAAFGDINLQILINGVLVANDTPVGASTWSLNASVAGTVGASMTVVAQYVVGATALSNSLFIHGLSMYLPTP
jgi:hypothetical protein